MHGPCFRVSSGVAVRFTDAANSKPITGSTGLGGGTWSRDRHRRALILDEPFRLTATFADLQRPNHLNPTCFLVQISLGHESSARGNAAAVLAADRAEALPAGY